MHPLANIGRYFEEFIHALARGGAVVWKVLVPLHPSPGRARRGQDMLEFALVFPILVLFLFGVVDMARVFHALISVSNAAREGARYGVTYGMSRTGGIYTPNTAAITTRTRAELSIAGVSPANSHVRVSCSEAVAAPNSATCLFNSNTPSCTQSGKLSVAVSYQFDFIIDGIIPGASLCLWRDAEMMIP
jgi:Flp pilus assembly protein TadG